MPDGALSDPPSVLVVDDQAFVREMVAHQLRRLGIQAIHQAADGRSALATLARADPPVDVLVCDLQMPDMDGVELLRHLPGRAEQVAVVLISGGDRRILESAETLAQAHGLTLLGTLAKPLTSQALAPLLAQRPKASAPATLTAAPPPLTAQTFAFNRVFPFFQPKVRLTDGTVAGLEALARWQHPDLGFLAPGQFLANLGREGLMDALTDRILTQALGWCHQWRQAGQPLSVAINVCAGSLHGLDLPDRIADATRAAGLPPETLTVEVTEHHLAENPAATLETLTRLRLKGIGLSIDDFGTGYATLEQLHRMPVTEMKIDRAFVQGARTSSRARAILDSSVSLARRLDLVVVAEGVETRADWDLVRAAGCDHAQGFWIARPMPGEAVLDWCRSWRPDDLPE